MNQYIYTHDDPANGIDPSGNFFVDVLAAVAVLEIIAAFSPSVAFGSPKDPTLGVLADANTDLGAVERVLIAEVNILNTNYKPGGEFGMGLIRVGAIIQNRNTDKGFYGYRPSIIGVITYGSASPWF